MGLMGGGFVMRDGYCGWLVVGYWVGGWLVG